MSDTPKAKKSLLWSRVTSAARAYGQAHANYVADEGPELSLALAERALEQAARAWADAGEGPNLQQILTCRCELRDRQWDPNTGKCRACGLIFKK